MTKLRSCNLFKWFIDVCGLMNCGIIGWGDSINLILEKNCVLFNISWFWIINKILTKDVEVQKSFNVSPSVSSKIYKFWHQKQ